MRVRLIHNEGAGDSTPSASVLIAALERAGFDVVHEPAFRKRKIPRWLEEPFDLAVAAGGDGTIAATVRALVGKSVPLAIARMGTSNNVAWALGLDAPVVPALEALADPLRVRLDVGVATGAWGERLFVEGVGVGYFAHVLAYEATPDDKARERALPILLDCAKRHAPRPWRVTIDGEDHSGEYFLVEALNIGAFGPGVRVAPRADPCDGLLDVVLLGERERKAFVRYLEALLEGDVRARLEVPVRRARHVHVHLAGESARIDDRVHPRPDAVPSHHLDVRLLPSAVELWLPRPRRHVRPKRPSSRPGGPPPG